jgi:hypothetical protein
MYESPIWIAARDLHQSITKEQDDYIIETVEKVLECKVDREELLKALTYDRDQYDKGFRDGRAYKPPIKTKYDLLTHMSADELAKWLEQNTHYQNGDMPWDYWLKQEAEL